MLHGPDGTGKTRFYVPFILAFLVFSAVLVAQYAMVKELQIQARRGQSGEYQALINGMISGIGYYRDNCDHIPMDADSRRETTPLIWQSDGYIGEFSFLQGQRRPAEAGIPQGSLENMVIETGVTKATEGVFLSYTVIDEEWALIKNLENAEQALIIIMIVMVVTTIVPGALMIESLSRRRKLTGTVLSSPGAPPWQSAADLFKSSRAVGLMAVSPGNRVLWANDRCRELLEMDRSGDGFPLASVTSLPESLRLGKGPGSSEYETGLVRLRSMTGDTAGVTMEVFPWVRDGEVRMRLFCFTLPSQVEAVSRRQGMNAQGDALEAGSGSEARMAESIMHDMNNHLSGIIGSASLALDRSGNEACSADGYRVILESAEKLTALCSDLNGILSGEEDPSLRDLMEETSLIAEVMRRILPDGVGFSVTGGTSKLIGVKRESLRNLLYNLALNSTEMMSGEGRIRVDISERIPPGAGGIGSVSPGGKICMRYSDGYIMPVALRDVLSGRKYSVPDVERQFGTTVGAVYRALGETGAEVRFERGSGETVLCMVMKAYERERTTDEDPSRPSEYPGMAGLSVLVAEEVEIILHSNCEYLEHRGMVTTPVTDGDKAMDMLRHGRFDAAVLDLSMPGVPTPSIVRYCQTSLPNMAVVITTGYGMNDQIRDLLKAPSTDCLYKPHRPEVLVETIYSTLMRIQEGEHT